MMRIIVTRGDFCVWIRVGSLGRLIFAFGIHSCPPYYWSMHFKQRFLTQRLDPCSTIAAHLENAKAAHARWRDLLINSDTYSNPEFKKAKSSNYHATLIVWHPWPFVLVCSFGERDQGCWKSSGRASEGISCIGKEQGTIFANFRCMTTHICSVV